MIRLITATPGSGKTCLVVEWLLREIDKGFYKSYYCNINGLNVAGVRPLLDDWREVPDDKKPALIIVDEAQYHDAFMKETTKDNKIGKDLSTHRHYGTDFWLITQSPKLLNPYVIENTGEHVHLYRPRKKKTVTVYWWSYAVTNLTKSNFKLADDEQKWRLNPQMFDYYKSTVAVTDGKARTSQRVVTAMIMGALFLGVIYFFVHRGSVAYEKMQRGDNNPIAINKDALPPTQAQPQQKVENVDFDCRKAENLDKKECKDYMNKKTEDHADLLPVNYDPNKPYDVEVKQPYKVLNQPRFSGCMKKGSVYVAYTEQGTILKDVSQSDCKRLLNDGDRPYDYFGNHAVKQQQEKTVVNDYENIKKVREAEADQQSKDAYSENLLVKDSRNMMSDDHKFKNYENVRQQYEQH